jgi:WD40 repeat protein
VKRWLVERDPGLADEIFLDLDPHTGIRPGERWKQALQQANSRCEAVICLLSKHWAASHECQTEFRYAETLNKTIVCARLEPIPDTNITSEWQRCDLFVGDGPTTEIPADGGEPVALSTEGLQRLREALRALGIGADYFPWPPRGDSDRTPYRGWAPLEEADAAVFFGRDAQIVRGLDAVRGMRASGVESLMVILGPSGAGKSSFLRAGLLPRLRRDDRRFLPLGIVRPERAVLTGELGLASAVHQLRTDVGLRGLLLGQIKSACLACDVEQLRSWLEEARQAAHTRLLEVPAEALPPTLIVPLDQGEELFNADAGPQAPRFLELLAGLLRCEAEVTPGLIVVVTIRADRYEPLQTAPELAGIQSVVFDELKPMPPAEFKEVITGPARRATAAGRRLTIEPALVDRLLADAAEGADSLPLLALTLQRLCRDFSEGGQLTVAEYQDTGGMGQVVETEVDNLLAADPAARQTQLELLHDAFIPWLATINPENDQPMRRLARWEDLPAASHHLIDALVDQRLLVKDTRDGHVVVEVALESLLRQWRELAAWLRAESEDLKDADSLERAAAAWQARGRDRAWLLEGTRLGEAESLAAKTGFRDRLDATREYLEASRIRENKRIEAEQRHHAAELQAAKDRQDAAEKLVAAAQSHALVLRKRSRILRTVLVLTLVVAAAAVYGFLTATKARHEAEARAREAVALNLTSQAQSMLAGAQEGGDLRALQQILAAPRISPAADASALFMAAVARRSTLKIIQTPDKVTSVAFSPDGHRIVSGGNDATLRLWDAGTGQPIGAPLAGHTDWVTSVAFSPDGHRIVSGSKDRTLRLWDAGTGQPIGAPLAGHTDLITSVAFSPDGHRIISGGNDATLRLWDAGTGQPIGAPLTGHTSTVTSVAFSPDGHRIVSGSVDHTVRLWNADTGQPVGQPLAGHRGYVTSVAFSPDGHRIVSGSDDNTLRLWDAGTGQPVGAPLIGHSNWVTSVAFSPDGHRIVSGSLDQMVRLWDAGTGPPVGAPLIGHSDWVASVAFSPDGHRIVSGSWDQTLRLWNADTGEPIGPPLTGHTSAVTSVAFSPDGRRIVSGSRDNTLRLWNADTGEPIGGPMIGHADRVFGVAFSPDGHRIVSGSGGGSSTLRLWNADTRQPIGAPLIGRPNSLSAVAFGPDGHRIVSGSNKTLQLWNADTGQPIGPPHTGHTDWVNSVAFSPDGHRIVSGSSDKTLRMWDAGTGQPIGAPLTGHTKEVLSVAFSPDGHRIVSGSTDGTLRLWDADTGKPIVSLTGHTSSVLSVAFSPDAQRVVSGSADNSLRLWSAPVASPDELCQKLTQNMSHQQWKEWVSPGIGYIAVCPGLPIPPDNPNQ